MAATLSQTSFVIDTKAIQKAVAIYRAINHSLRLQVVGIIHKAGAINDTPIIKQLKLEQSLISAHLKILRDAKIVKTEKKGNSVYYSIDYQEVNRISVLAEKLIPYRTHTSELLQNADRKLILKIKEDTVSFTPTELKVIRLVCEQNTTEEIAKDLGIGRRTVEEHRSNIIRKMKVRNSVGILFFSIKNGLFKI
jgi:DNA-binding CsgD family transcriptional regulator/DNA-binding transcriptional ArsR family regulator